MSLAALNQPSLVLGSGGILVAYALPALERAIADGALSFASIRALNILMFGLNVYATTRPGRIDGPNQDELASDLAHPRHHPKSAAKNREDLMDVYRTDQRGRTLLAPSGWAFAIWGPIFAGELLFCLSAIALLDESKPVATLVRRASAGFMVAQAFQALWTASFRPKYAKGHALYVSSLMLGGIAWSMGRAHRVFANLKDRNLMSRTDYLLYFFPMTLHFGWTAAATLVNMNGNVASRMKSSPQLIAGVGHASALVASALGLYITSARRAPVFGCVIAWALAGCAAGMRERLAAVSSSSSAAGTKKVPESAGAHGASLQLSLCGLGALANAAASLFVATRRE
jgi:hypothetical protein